MYSLLLQQHLLIRYNKDLNKHITDNVEVNKDSIAQHLILSPNSYQCQEVFNKLSKTGCKKPLAEFSALYFFTL